MIAALQKIHYADSYFVRELFHDQVAIQEKVDGSQFSFSMDEHEQVHCRSSGVQLYPESMDETFRKGVEYAQSLSNRLVPGYVYRCEYLLEPKHSSLTYARVPRNNFALFDVEIGREWYQSYTELQDTADKLEIEAVPQLYYGEMTYEGLEQFLETDSFLGRVKIEGVVVKNYHRFCHATGKVLWAKYVSDDFKEVHATEWGGLAEKQADIHQQLIDEYRTTQRWEKAVLRMRDRGMLQNKVQDIGPLMATVWPDIVAECKPQIMEKLWQHHSRRLQKAMVGGFPEWYKQRLGVDDELQR
jgi:hypothetical protein